MSAPETVKETIKTADGSLIVLRKLKAIDQVRLLRAIGPAQSSNEPYVRIVHAAAAVESVDGVFSPVPQNEAQIDRMIQQVGDDALNAIVIKQMADLKAAYDDIMAKQQAEDEAAAAAAKAAGQSGGEEVTRPLAPSSAS